jgi:hypothetical protein
MLILSIILMYVIPLLLVAVGFGLRFFGKSISLLIIASPVTVTFFYLAGLYYLSQFDHALGAILFLTLLYFLFQLTTCSLLAFKIYSIIRSTNKAVD